MNKYSSNKDSEVEWIDVVPSHWKKNKIKYISSFRNGFSFKSNDWKKQGIPVIRMSNIGVNGKIKLNPKNLKYVSEDIFERTKGYSIEKGDILISMTDMNPEMIWLGSTILFQEEGSWLLNQRVGNIRVDTSFVSSKFYHYLSNTDFIRNQLKTSVYPNVQTNLSTEPIKNEVLFLPPLLEQQQIVSFLDDKTHKIDSLIQKKQRKIELLKEKRISLINHVVTKGLDSNVEMKDSGVEWIGEIPSHWEKLKLNYISQKIGDGLHSTPSYVDSSEYYFINGNNLIDGEIKFFESTKCVSEEEFQKHYIELNENSLLLSINGTIGNLSFYNGEKVILGKSSCYINLIFGTNREFIYYVLLSDSISRYFTFELTGTTIFNLSLNSVRKTPIPFPPKEEQQQIVEYLDEQTEEIDTLIQLEKNKIKLLKEYRQSLISEVVIGKIKVTD